MPQYSPFWHNNKNQKKKKRIKKSLKIKKETWVINKTSWKFLKNN